MGSAPPTTTRRDFLSFSARRKINEYSKIGEQGMAISAWRSEILKDSERVIA
ncbi:hypothetical protein KI387_031211, partial [Taxus chinensis]